MGDYLIVMHSAVRACPGYNRHDAPSILMDGTSLARDTEHGRAVAAQLSRRIDTLGAAIEAGVLALGAAGLEKGIRRQARGFAEDYFYTRLGLAADLPLPAGPEGLRPGLELMPEDMYLALADAVELVVDGEYGELSELSHGRLEVEDLHRRVEIECPAALVLPPRQHYIVEAITKSAEAGHDGWAFFLDLWEEHGLARLHIEGELERSGQRLRTTLLDVAP